MFTSCPECGTVFRISAADLRVAEGYVRCGHCSAIFNALLSLAEQPPASESHLPPELPEQATGFTGEAETDAALGPFEEEQDDELPSADEDEDEDEDEEDSPEDWETETSDDSTEDEAELADDDVVAEQEEDEDPASDESLSDELLVDESPLDESPVEESLIEESGAEEAPALAPLSAEEAAEADEDWSRLFDEEDLKEATARMQVELTAPSPTSANPPANPPANSDADESDEEADAAPVFVIEGEPIDIGAWAWEPTQSPDPVEEPSLSETSRQRRAPVEDLWAEEFADVPLTGSPDRAEPHLGDPAEGYPAGESSAAWEPAPVESWGTADSRVEPSLGRGMESAVSPSAPPLAAANEPADAEAAPPPLWTQRPTSWDYSAEESAGDNRRWYWGLGSLLLALGLAAQWVHHGRDDLATSPTVGPALRQVYSAMGATLYPRWSLNAYEIRGTEAIAGRSAPGALDILARVTVVGSDPVGLPRIRVTLRDRFGKVLGARILAPAEYLETGSTLVDPLLPGAVIPIRVSLADPGSDAYGYEVDVCVEDRRTGLQCQAEREPFRR